MTGATFSSRAAQETIRARLEKAAALPRAVPASRFQFSWFDVTALLMLAVNLVFFFFPASGPDAGHPAILQRGGIRSADPLLFVLVAVQRLAPGDAALEILRRVTRLSDFRIALHLERAEFLLRQRLPVRRSAGAGGPVRQKTRSQDLSGHLPRRPYLRRLILGATVLAAICGVAIPFVEPFSAFLPGTAWWIFGMAAGFLLASVFVPRLWCRWFCGCGALLDFFHKTK